MIMDGIIFFLGIAGLTCLASDMTNPGRKLLAAGTAFCVLAAAHFGMAR